MSTAAPPLAADLEAGLRRSNWRRSAGPPRAAPRRQGPTSGTRAAAHALVEAEVAARDASMTAARLKAAGFPVKKSVEDFDFPSRASRGQPWTTWPAWSGSSREPLPGGAARHRQATY